MKKIKYIISSLALILNFASMPLMAHAQSTIDVESDAQDEGNDGATNVSAEETAEPAVKSPDTGIAPQSGPMMSMMVFVGGAALGGAIGFGYIQLKKRNQN